MVDICIAFGISKAVLSLVIDTTVWNGIVNYSVCVCVCEMNKQDNKGMRETIIFMHTKVSQANMLA